MALLLRPQLNQRDDRAVDFVVDGAIGRTRSEYSRPCRSFTFRSCIFNVSVTSRRIFSKSGISMLGLSSVIHRRISVGRMLKALRAVGVARRTISARSTITIGIWTLLNRLSRSLVSCIISRFRLLNSSFSVVNSSLVDCNSSFAVSSSSFINCNSSFLESNS